MGVGLFLPPIGLGVLIGCSIGNVTIINLARRLFPYLAVNFVMVLLLTYRPWVTPAIPKLVFG